MTGSRGENRSPVTHVLPQAKVWVILSLSIGSSIFFGDHQNFEDFQNFGRSSKIIENCACPNLDAMSVPEALVYSILHHFAQL